MTSDRLTEVAKVWNAAVEAGESPQSAIRDAFPEFTQRTAQRWVRDAGEAGLLAAWSPTNWRSGPRLQAVADDLGLARHELAQAVLRHSPNGRLHVHEYDAIPASVPQDLPAAFGDMVRTARTAREWSQKELAAKVGAALGREITPLAITRTEAGTRPVPVSEVAALALVLGFSVDELIRTQVRCSGEAP